MLTEPNPFIICSCTYTHTNNLQTITFRQNTTTTANLGYEYIVYENVTK